MITFETNHFSTYVFVEEAVKAANTGDNAASAIYVAFMLLLAGAVVIRMGMKKKIQA